MIVTITTPQLRSLAPLLCRHRRSKPCHAEVSLGTGHAKVPVTCHRHSHKYTRHNFVNNGNTRDRKIYYRQSQVLLSEAQRQEPLRLASGVLALYDPFDMIPKTGEPKVLSSISSRFEMHVPLCKFQQILLRFPAATASPMLFFVRLA